MKISVSSASRRTRKFVMLMLVLSPFVPRAQRQRTYTNGLWACYFSNTRIGKRFLLMTETELHTREWAQHWAEQVMDVGFANRLNEKWRVASGGAWYRSAQYLDEFFFKNEWRLWQDASFYLIGKRMAFLQRLKLEERWLQQVANGKKLHSYDYVTRLRYKAELQKPLQDGAVTPVFGNEFMFNPGYWNSSRFADQNRTWIGVNFKVAHATTLQVHYLKIFYWRTNNTLENANIFRLNIVQQFNQKG